MATITTGFLSEVINGLTINKSYPCNSGNYTNSSSRDVKYVGIHYTGNQKDSALSNCKYFQTNSRGASAHFFCDDNSIYQSVELRDKAWHCGCSTGYKNACRNNNSFGIEMCTSGNYLVSEKTQINAAYLCAHLCKMIGITSSTVDTYVVRHYDIVKTDKLCPKQYVQNPSEWTRFKTWVKNILNTGNHNGVALTEKTKVTYTSHRIETNKWGNEIVGYNLENSMGYSGSFGKKIDKVTIKLSEGTITYTVHRDGKWGGEIHGYSTTDTNNYAGSSNKPIDAIAIKATGINGKLKYRVHRTDGKWGGWITGYSKTDTNNYAGSFGKPIDAIQIGIE